MAAQVTNAQRKAREVALSILKAYHAEIKSGFIANTSATERERAQAKAFEVAEKHVREIVLNAGTESATLDEERRSYE